MFSTPLSKTGFGVVLIGVAALWVGGAAAQEAGRPGLDSPRVRVAIADFRAVGGDDAPARELSDGLRRALSAHPQVQVIAGDEVRAALAAAEREVLDLREGASRALGDKLGVDAVIYGRLVADVNGLLDDPLPATQPAVQVAVAETLTIEGQLYPSAALPLKDPPTTAGELAKVALGLLPATGRVLSIIESPEGVAIQLFPVGGRVLAANAEYGVYDPARFRVPIQDPGGRSEALARQDLRLGAATGRVRTQPDMEDHAASAVSSDPAGRISVGQLVGLPPVAGTAPQRMALPLVIVNATPADAVVLCNGRLAGVTPVAVPLEAGKQVALTIARRDHTPAGYEVTAGEGEGLAMSIALQEIPPFGSLRIATTPPGASADLDGKDLGKTPLTADNLPAGEHKLTVTMDGFKPLSHALSVRRQKTTELNLSLQKDFRRVRIVSEPGSAHAFLDGEAVGTTPLDLETVQTGQHELKLTLAGHATLKEMVTVKPDEAAQTLSFRLRTLAGNLRIETTPAGAGVSIDGQDRGKTPVAITALAIGQHQVALHMDGYLPVTKTVEVQDQQTAVVQEPLTKAAGNILCVSVPAGATISLEGEDVGVTPKTLSQVPIGRRQVTLSLNGYQKWSGRVPVAHGETTKVEVGLIREPGGLRRVP